jgi:hypothetical protein
VLGLRGERPLQTVGIEARHAISDHAIERRRGRRIVIVREVGARDDERIAAVQHVGERVAERARGFFGLVSHHERNDCRGGREALHERQLHLERMLASVRSRIFADDRRRSHQFRGARFVNPRDAERRLEAAPRVQRDAAEADVMRRSYENGDVEMSILKQPVRVCGNGTRVHQSRVRRDERDQVSTQIARGRPEMSIDGSGERRRRPRVPRSCDRRLSNVGHFDPLSAISSAAIRYRLSAES